MFSHHTQAHWSPSVQVLAMRAIGALAALGALAGLVSVVQPKEPSAMERAKTERQAEPTRRDVAFMAVRSGLKGAIGKRGQSGDFMLVDSTTVGRRDVFTVAQMSTGCRWVIESESWNKAPRSPVSVEPKTCGVAPSQARPTSKDKVDALFMTNAAELARVARGGSSERFALVKSFSATRSADRVVMIDAATGCRLIGRIEKFGSTAPAPDGVGISCKE